MGFNPKTNQFVRLSKVAVSFVILNQLCPKKKPFHGLGVLINLFKVHGHTWYPVGLPWGAVV